MSLGLGSTLKKSGVITPGIITDNLVMKHNYSANGNRPVSDGACVFNGTSDYIAISASGDAGTVGSGAAVDSTYCWWMKASETSYNKGVFGHGDNNIGAFDLNHTSDRPLLYLAADYYQYWEDNSAQDDGRWHHWALVLDVDDLTNGCKLYVDGVLQVQASRDDSGSATAYSTDLTIGRSNTSMEFEGYLCNFGVWSGFLTQPQIKSIMWKNYADLTSTETTSLVSWWNLDSNLTTQGSSSWVADEENTTFGSDVTPTWTTANTAVIDGQTITLGSSGIVSAIATISPVGVYKVNVTVTGYTGSGNIEMPWAGTGSSNMQISANGTYEFYESSSDTGWTVYAADGRGATITINSITKANGNIGELI